MAIPPHILEQTIQGAGWKKGAYIKHPIMSALLNSSNVKGEAIYFASTLTRLHTHAHMSL